MRQCGSLRSCSLRSRIKRRLPPRRYFSLVRQPFSVHHFLSLEQLSLLSVVDAGQHLSDVHAVPVLLDEDPQQQSLVQQSLVQQQSQVQQSGTTDSQPQPQSQPLAIPQFSQVILNAKFPFGQLQFAIKKSPFICMVYNMKEDLFPLPIYFHRYRPPNRRRPRPS